MSILPILAYRLGLGGVMNSFHLLILTTWGRQTGLPQHTALEYRAHGSKLYLLALAEAPPGWLRDLVAQPTVRIVRGSQVLNTRASIITDQGEVRRVLHLFRNRASFIYASVLRRFVGVEQSMSYMMPQDTTSVTVVRLDASDDVVGPPAVAVDLWWLWLLSALCTALLIVIGVRRR